MDKNELAIAAFSSLKAELNINGQISICNITDDRTLIKAKWTEKTNDKPCLTLKWALPVDDIQHKWHPEWRYSNMSNLDWYSRVTTSLSHSAPVFVFYNCAGINRFTFALSDAATAIILNTEIVEENGTLKFNIEIPLDPTGASNAYSVMLFTDFEAITFSKALLRVTQWWENECGYSPMAVPENAKLPIYSTWYSYHQSVTDKDVERECAIASALGMHTVIVDDGWQFDTVRRDYAYCGDWAPASCKMTDLRKTVEKVHAMGMKFMLWYSVPFVGYLSKCWQKFQDKLLKRIDELMCGVLDPRYPEVRQYLIETYVYALKRYNLDGLKLDFIDSFSVPDTSAPSKPGMDYCQISPAVNRLMTDIINELKKLKPDILIEFRQGYIGPLMRTYGNMLRVGDCPDSSILNRIGTIDLRLLSGKTAVHSDMLMWHENDSAEAAALQLISVLFSVPQISLRLEKLSEKHKKVLSFWLGFMKEYRQLLLDAPIEVDEPQNHYTTVSAVKDGTKLIVMYSGKRIIEPEKYDTVLIVNGCYSEPYVLTGNGVYTYRIINCCGEQVSEGKIVLNNLQHINIPVCGLVKLKAEKEYTETGHSINP